MDVRWKAAVAGAHSLRSGGRDQPLFSYFFKFVNCSTFCSHKQSQFTLLGCVPVVQRCKVGTRKTNKGEYHPAHSRGLVVAFASKPIWHYKNYCKLSPFWLRDLLSMANLNLFPNKPLRSSRFRFSVGTQWLGLPNGMPPWWCPFPKAGLKGFDLEACPEYFTTSMNGIFEQQGCMSACPSLRADWRPCCASPGIMQ